MRHAVGWITVLAVTGCSGSYTPANSPRVSMVVRGGVVSYYKDGTEYPGGLFGSGAADAVRGNPRAVAEAEKGRDLVVGGFVLSLVGLGAVVGGVVVAANSNDHTNELNGSETAAVALMLGGLGVSIIGSILTLNGVPHFYDAVAIYNDGVPPVPPPHGATHPPLSSPPPVPPPVDPQRPPLPHGPEKPADKAPGVPATQPPGT